LDLLLSDGEDYDDEEEDGPVRSLLVSLLKPGVSPSQLEQQCYQAAQPYVLQLVNLVLTSPEELRRSASPSSTHPFADSIKGVVEKLVGHLVHVLQHNFTNGLNSVDRLVKFNLEHRLGSGLGELGGGLGFMLPMASGMVSSMVMRSYQAYQSASLSAGDDWLQLVPEAERKMWADTIEQDKKTQLEMKRKAVVRAFSQAPISIPGIDSNGDGQQKAVSLVAAQCIQPPLSAAYKSGSIGTSAVASPAAKFVLWMERALMLLSPSPRT